MKTRNALMTTVAASLLAASPALAGSIIIDGLGGEVVMQSAAIDGVFDGAEPTLTDSGLGAVHSALHADGISTEGMVTFVLADTSEGLSFITLVDDPTSTERGTEDSVLGMASTADASVSHWINDEGADISTLINPFDITKTAAGTFSWDGASEGDGFAWSGLEAGDGVTFDFSDLGAIALAAGQPFQFVTWTGEAWEVITVAGFTAAGLFSFSFTVVPLPASLAMGLAGLGGIGLLRRRKLA